MALSLRANLAQAALETPIKPYSGLIRKPLYGFCVCGLLINFCYSKKYNYKKEVINKYRKKLEIFKFIITILFLIIHWLQYDYLFFEILLLLFL